jgi:hypothetical protein
MNITNKHLKQIIKEELKKVLKEFKDTTGQFNIDAEEMPDEMDVSPETDVSSEIELTIQPDIQGAQREILRQFAMPQR